MPRNPDTSATPQAPQRMKPSDLAQMTENELGDALINIRRELRSARDVDDLKQLKETRDEITKRLDKFVIMNLKAIDKDPQIKSLIADLSELTLATRKAVSEMRSVKKTIDRATKIIGFADQFVAIVGKVAGV